MTQTPSWYLYIIRCSNGSLYTGVTLDVERRFAEHLEQGPKCAKYLRGKMPLTLVYTERQDDKKAAYRREFEIKRLSREDKEKIIKSYKIHHNL